MILQPAIGVPFQVNGVAVTLMNPVFVKLIIPVTWPPNHDPTLEEQCVVQARTEAIVRYLLDEDMIYASGTEMMVMVKRPDPPNAQNEEETYGNRH